MILDGWLKREKRESNKQPTAAWWYSPAVPKSKSGKQVNPDTALAFSAVHRCVSLISQTCGWMPLHLYRRISADSKERAYDHALYKNLRYKPNRAMKAFNFWQTLTASVLLRGNAYAQIVRTLGGNIELWPLWPDDITVEFDRLSGTKRYIFKKNTKDEHEFAHSEIMHAFMFSLDGLKGVSVITYAREAIGLGLAAEEFGAAFFGNGAHMHGFFSFEPNGTAETRKEFRAAVNEMHQGSDNAWKFGVFGNNTKWNSMTIDPQDAQYLETRKFEVRDICRWFGVPPHMAQDLDNATFTNIEHQGIDFNTHTMAPYRTMWEQAIFCDLLTEQEQGTYYAEFLTDAIMQGDIKSRNEAYMTGRMGGWLCADDIRALQNMNPLPNGQGKIFLQPVNMTIPGTLPDENAPIDNNAKSAGIRVEFKEILQGVNGNAKA